MALQIKADPHPWIHATTAKPLLLPDHHLQTLTIAGPITPSGSPTTTTIVATTAATTTMVATTAVPLLHAGSSTQGALRSGSNLELRVSLTLLLYSVTQ